MYKFVFEFLVELSFYLSIVFVSPKSLAEPITFAGLEKACVKSRYSQNNVCISYVDPRERARPMENLRASSIGYLRKQYEGSFSSSGRTKYF